MIDAQRFAAWIREVQGRYINMDGAYGAQCWDLHAHFADWFGLPRVNTGYAGRWVGWAGNMYDAYPQTPAIEAAYERVPGHLPAEPGDTVIWDDSYWYYPKTHVAVVVRDGAQLLCMSQNSTPSQGDNPYPAWSTGPTTLQHLPKGGLLGYLRPRGGITPQSTTTVIEDEIDMAAEENIKARLEEIVRWMDGKLGALAEQSESNRNALAGFVRDVVVNQGSITAAEIDAKFQELAAQDHGTVKLLKGTGDDTVYAWDPGTGLRGLTLDEYLTLTAAGAVFVELDQTLFDKLKG